MPQKFVCAPCKPSVPFGDKCSEELSLENKSFVWIFIVTWVVFGIASCAAGHWARIPFIADSADASVR
eukprot:1157987-Pelagomonas_calceolata.AAC.3